MLDTLVYLKHETQVWFEITTLLIPGENDSPGEVEKLCRWVADHLGPAVPLHFTAFHPDWRMREQPPTPPATLTRARAIARETGLRYVYTGNVHDPEGGSTRCPSCAAMLIERDWYKLGAWNLDAAGRCRFCRTPIPGLFEPRPGGWGPKRLPIRLSAVA